jgi:preprotein translocase subunit YajC
VVWLYAQDATGGSGLGALLPLLVFGAAIYFLIMRPQRARARKQQEIATSLEIGDQVQTIAGVFGVIVSIDEEAVVLGIEEGRMRVAKRAIAQRIHVGDDE